jgi:hypothetical protein
MAIQINPFDIAPAVPYVPAVQSFATNSAIMGNMQADARAREAVAQAQAQIAFEKDDAIRRANIDQMRIAAQERTAGQQAQNERMRTNALLTQSDREQATRKAIAEGDWASRKDVAGINARTAANESTEIAKGAARRASDILDRKDKAETALFGMKEIGFPNTFSRNYVALGKDGLFALKPNASTLKPEEQSVIQRQVDDVNNRRDQWASKAELLAKEIHGSDEALRLIEGQLPRGYFMDILSGTVTDPFGNNHNFRQAVQSQLSTPGTALPTSAPAVQGATPVLRPKATTRPAVPSYQQPSAPVLLGQSQSPEFITTDFTPRTAVPYRPPSVAPYSNLLDDPAASAGYITTDSIPRSYVPPTATARLTGPPAVPTLRVAQDVEPLPPVVRMENMLGRLPAGLAYSIAAPLGLGGFMRGETGKRIGWDPAVEMSAPPLPNPRRDGSVYGPADISPNEFADKVIAERFPKVQSPSLYDSLASPARQQQSILDILRAMEMARGPQTIQSGAPIDRSRIAYDPYTGELIW